jgi:hypothetical protein
MAYPYLPVNPCCTDIVINDVCGCSSTITNSGCNTNDPCSTNLTASSTIVYNGPALTCTTAEPCDTLNVILQKIDEIICNLLSQINILTTQVNNISSQVLIINNDISDIYNTLDVCCPVTTTTTTTLYLPCRSFLLTNTESTPLAIIINNCVTGLEEAVLLLPGATEVCITSTSLLVVPGTVIATPTGPCNTTTTTTSSSSSTTTTTTTVAIPCECLTINNTDIVGNYFSYTDCNNITSDFIPIAAGEIIKVCGCCAVSTNPLITITIGADCIDAVCPTTTTTTTAAPTTTTTTTVPPTTTTTTTAYPYPCSCVHVAISQTDLDDATGNTPAPGKADNTVYLTTTKNSGCDESNIDTEYTVAGLSGFCIKTSSLSTIQLFYYKNNNPVYFPAIASTYNILYANCSVSGQCIPM